MNTKFDVDNSGNLIITLTEEGKQWLEDHKEDSEFVTDEGLFVDLIEYQLCNGYSLVQPIHVGALTDSLLIADGYIDEDTTNEQAEGVNVWYYNYYALRSYLDDLKTQGYVIWNRV